MRESSLQLAGGKGAEIIDVFPGKETMEMERDGKKHRRSRFAMGCCRHAEKLPKLTKDQTVDHISGVRSNDAKDNLRVFTGDPNMSSSLWPDCFKK